MIVNLSIYKIFNLIHYNYTSRGFGVLGFCGCICHLTGPKTSGMTQHHLL